MVIGLLLIRMVVGLALAAHGAQKLFGIFGGHGIAGTGKFFESLGLRPGNVAATAAGAAELCGGLAFAAGLATPLAAAAIIATMAVAIFTVHIEKGFFSQDGGYELPLINAAVAAGLAFHGPGRISADSELGLAWFGERWGLIAIGLGALGAIATLAAREVANRRADAGARG